MRNGGWLRRHWFWVAGGAFLGVHAATWLMQRAVKSVVRSEVRSEVALKDKPAEEE